MDKSVEVDISRLKYVGTYLHYTLYFHFNATLAPYIINTLAIMYHSMYHFFDILDIQVIHFFLAHHEIEN